SGLSQEFDAGVIIHEDRFTYASRGLKKVADLGQMWEDETGLPIPLGGFFSKQSINSEIHDQLSGMIRESILFAFANPARVMEYVRPLAQEFDDQVMQDHIKLYVNDYSVELGAEGMKAIETMGKA